LHLFAQIYESRDVVVVQLNSKVEVGIEPGEIINEAMTVQAADAVKKRLIVD
jgi:hypothetical protein